jgi:hypothetical protein
LHVGAGLIIEVRSLRCVQGTCWKSCCATRTRKCCDQIFRVYFVPRGPQTGSAAWIFMRRGRSRQRCVYFCLAILCAQGWLSRKNKTNMFTCHNTSRRTNSWIPRARCPAPGLILALTHGKFLAPSSKASLGHISSELTGAQPLGFAWGLSPGKSLAPSRWAMPGASPGNLLGLYPEGMPGAYLVGNLKRLAAGLYMEAISKEISGA